LVVAITDAVAAALKEEFAVPVYGGRVKQGLVKPCFIIDPVKVSRSCLRGERYELLCLIETRYFTEDFDELHDVARRLFDTLEVVRLSAGGRVRGSGMCYETDGDTLRFFTEYRVILWKVESVDVMEELVLNP